MVARPAKTQISLASAQSDQSLRSAWAFAQFDLESSLCAQWRMPRLICVFAGRTCHFVGFSWGGWIILEPLLSPMYLSCQFSFCPDSRFVIFLPSMTTISFCLWFFFFAAWTRTDQNVLNEKWFACCSKHLFISHELLLLFSSSMVPWVNRWFAWWYRTQ